jgi:KDO2-lipid IV(A) lauroyltransferase
MLAYFLFRLAGLILPHVPVRLGYWLFAGLGTLSYHLNKRARAIVRHNMSHVLGPQASAEQVEEATRGVFRCAGQNYFDLFRLASLDERQLEEAIEAEGWDVIDAALARGHGAILVTAHFGAPDIVAQLVSGRGYPVTAIVEHLQPEPLFRYVCSLRGSHGLRLLPVDGVLRELFRALRRNEVIGLVADRDITESGIEVEFFGEPARMADGHVQLALRTGATLVVGYCIRRPDGTFFARGVPVELDRTGDRERDVRTGVHRVLAHLETFIAAHPDQWVMFQPIWKMKGNHG